jgi:hypothetical protein
MEFEVLFGVGLYFIPTIIAASRNNPKLLQVMAVNLVFGWTGLGWIAVLAIALGEPPADHREIGSSAPTLSVADEDPADKLCRELAEIRAPAVSGRSLEAAEQIRFAKECFNSLKEVLNQKFNPSELAYERYFSSVNAIYQSVLDNGALMLSTLVSLDLSCRAHALEGEVWLEHEGSLAADIGRVDQLKEENQVAIAGLVQTSRTLSQLNLVDGRIPEGVDEAMRQLEKVVARTSLYDRSQSKN